MTLDELYRKCLKKLDGIENSATDLRIILKHALHFNETEFLLNKQTEISEDQETEILFMVERRISGEPVQYIIGEWDFYGTTFKVNKNVLIPRPETELLCENVIDYLKNKGCPRVADLCAGSGCIGITVKLHTPQSEVILVEKSPEASRCCLENIKNILGEGAVELRTADIFYPEKIGKLPIFDLVISNPPYIKSSEIPHLQSEVLFEPEIALDGGEDGLDFYRVLCDKWTDYLAEDGMFAFECGEEQADEIRSMLEIKNFEVHFLKDYNNVDRFVIGKRRLQ